MAPERCSISRFRLRFSGTVVAALGRAGLTAGNRVMIESLRSRSRLRAGPEPRTARGPRRGTDPAHRPLLGQAAGAGHPLSTLRQCTARTGVEPRARRCRAGHPGRRLRSGGPWRVLRFRRGAARCGADHLLQVLALIAMEAPVTPGHRSLWDKKVEVFRAMADADRNTAFTPSTRGTSAFRVCVLVRSLRPMWRCASRWTIGVGRACRSSFGQAKRSPRRLPRSG